MTISELVQQLRRAAELLPDGDKTEVHIGDAWPLMQVVVEITVASPHNTGRVNIVAVHRKDSGEIVPFKDMPF